MKKLLVIKETHTHKILNRAKEYYENNKERLREQARNKYRELSRKEKDTKKEYGGNSYKNMSEDNKQRLKEYQKIIVKQKNQRKSLNLVIIRLIK